MIVLLYLFAFTIDYYFISLLLFTILIQYYYLFIKHIIVLHLK